MRRLNVASETEGSILIAIFETPDVPYDAYSLTLALHSDLEPRSPEHKRKFDDVRTATEDLIVKGLLKGKRLKGHEGIYYSGLKLTGKGEQAAIVERRNRAELEKKLPAFLKDANAVVEEMKRAEGKKK
ncbi:MAG: hypothetical protein ACR2IF_04705 [Terriglobales bacterium]